MPGVDVDAYLERIGHRGDPRRTLATLTDLVRAHGLAIPFENLDVLLRRPVRLNLDALQAKLVAARRGGYCFEHATLFAAVLEALGFAPVRHTARVVLFVPRSAAPRTHMLLTVRLEGERFVLDPGFGNLAPQFPVPLMEQPVPSADATHWMVRDDGHWVLRGRTADGIVDCWATTLEADNAVDFELGNHYTATHPASPFVNRLMLRALTADGYVSVMNRDVTHVRADQTERRQLADRAALRALLNRHFGFDLPEVETMSVPSIEEWQ